MSEPRCTLSVSRACKAKIDAFVKKTGLRHREAVEMCLDIGLDIFGGEVDETFRRIAARVSHARQEVSMRN